MLLGGNLPVAGDRPAAPEVLATAIDIAARTAAEAEVRIDLAEVPARPQRGVTPIAWTFDPLARRRGSSLARAWRKAVREILAAALGDGFPAVGPDGWFRLASGEPA